MSQIRPNLEPVSTFGEPTIDRESRIVFERNGQKNDWYMPDLDRALVVQSLLMNRWQKEVMSEITVQKYGENLNKDDSIRVHSEWYRIKAMRLRDFQESRNEQEEDIDALPLRPKLARLH